MKVAFLVIWVLGFPNTPVKVGGYETESQCHAAFRKIDESTPVRLRHECRVRT